MDLKYRYTYVSRKQKRKHPAKYRDSDHKTFIHKSLYIARLNYTLRVLFKYKCSSSEESLVGGFFSLQKFKISLKYFDVKKKKF